MPALAREQVLQHIHDAGAVFADASRNVGVRDFERIMDILSELENNHVSKMQFPFDFTIRPPEDPGTSPSKTEVNTPPEVEVNV